MQTTAARGVVRTKLSRSDHRVIGVVLDLLGPHTKLPPKGHWRSLDSKAIWTRIVEQICVMGSSRGLDKLKGEPSGYQEFRDAVSLDSWAARKWSVSSMAKVLQRYGATRFYNKAAEKLRTVAKLPSVVDGTQCNLLRSLPVKQGYERVRVDLMDRCPIFKMKSASDYMIDMGLSRDVIALDVRIVGTLRRYLGYNLPVSKLQSSETIYRSVETALRDATEAHGHCLARLDRALFRFSDMSALEFAFMKAGRPRG